VIELNRNPSRSQLRWFAGLWFPAFWGLVGFLLYRRLGAGPIPYTVWAAAAAVSVAGLIAPRFMRWVYLGMMTVTYPIGWTVSNLILMLVYYLVLTPTGVIMRLVGRDPMQRELERDVPTYWVPRETDRSPSRYFRQY
jgi:hypothetical protein